MSLRYEMHDAFATDVAIAGPGTELGEDDLGPDTHALIIGDPCSSAYAIIGSLDALSEFAELVTHVVIQALPSKQEGPSTPSAD
jgi:hypothetical protein